MEIIISGRDKVERYTSRVEGIAANQLYIAMPMRKSVPVLLIPGTKFNVRFIVNQTCWQFTSTLIDKQIMPLPIWIVTLPTELERIQLRSFVRLQISLPIQISIITAEGEAPPLKIISKDISGGGTQIVSSKHLPVGTKMHLEFNLPEKDAIRAKGEVVRSDKPSGTDVYWIAVKFIEISERDREKIIKYVFKVQIERHQKGL